MNQFGALEVDEGVVIGVGVAMVPDVNRFVLEMGGAVVLVHQHRKRNVGGGRYLSGERP